MSHHLRVQAGGVRRRLSGAIAWSLCSVTAVLVAANLLIGIQTVGRPLPDLLQFRWWEAFGPLMGLGFSVVGALIVSRNESSSLGWLACAIGLLNTTYLFSQSYAAYGLYVHPGALPGATWMAWLRSWSWYPGAMLVLAVLPLVFPDGRLPSARWRPLLGVIAAITVVYCSITALTTHPLGLPLPRWFVRSDIAVAGVTMVCCTVAAAVALVYRYRSASPEMRQQIKWLAVVVAIQAVLWLASLIPAAVENVPPYRVPVLEVVIPLALLGLPVAIGFAVFRYHLYDIDLVIGRAVVYGVLAAFITATYVVIVGGAGLLAGSRFNLALSVLATAVVAVAFQPVRERVQRLSARLIYGEPPSSHEILARLSREAASADSVEGVLAAIAAAVSEAAGGRPSRASLIVPALRRVDATAPSGAELDAVVWSIPVGPGPLGQLEVAGEPLSASEQLMVKAVAAQAELAMRNLSLAAELAASRIRLVQAEERGRRRLERDLHDGVQQQVVALIAKLRLARNQLQRNGSQAEALVAEAQDEARQTLADLRELARGIHPAVLGSRGLVEAVEAAAARMPVAVRVEADEGVRAARFAEEIEGAAYFTISEGLANALKHARANEVRIAISAAAARLTVTVADDGRGFDIAHTRQTGLAGLRDRIEALSGTFEVSSGPRGTHLAATLPAFVRHGG